MIFNIIFDIIYIENKKGEILMEICVRSAYDYLVCESRFDTKELLQAIKKDLDINFGSTYGFSSKKENGKK